MRILDNSAISSDQREDYIRQFEDLIDSETRPVSLELNDGGNQPTPNMLYYAVEAATMYYHITGSLKYIDEIYNYVFDNISNLSSEALHAALCRAVRAGDGWHSFVKMVLEDRPGLINFKNHQSGNTLLHFAMGDNHPAMMRILMNRGANPYILNNDGLTPYSMVKVNSYDKPADALRRIQRFIP